MPLNGLVDIFDLLDKWRHLPDYQLERRADIFFAMYLPKFLSSNHDSLPWLPRADFRSSMIPEFPVRIGTLHRTESNQSVKVDYVAITESGSDALFIELKTDCRSRRPEQDDYLDQLLDLPMDLLLRGIPEIALKSKHQRKYSCLLRLLHEHKLITLPKRFRDDLPSIEFKSCLKEIKVNAPCPEKKVAYLQPTRAKIAPCTISFACFAEWLEKQGDELSDRFALSLRKWDKPEAGA